MNRNYEGVPPLPPRRTAASATVLSSDARLLHSVPPPPPSLLTSARFGALTHSQSSLNAFSNNTYNNAMSAHIPHSHSAPDFHDDAHQTLEHIRRLVSGHTKESRAVPKKPNNDLIDLSAADDDIDDDRDVLILFDPLLHHNHDDRRPPPSPPPPPTPLRPASPPPSVVAADDDQRSSPVVEERILAPNGEPEARLRVASKRMRANAELADVWQSLRRLRARFAADDRSSNVGLVVSPTLEWPLADRSLSVKLVIESSLALHQPVSFTCNVDTSVEHVISQVLCSVVDDASQENAEAYALKVWSRAEYLSPASVLADYAFVHHCHKLDTDVHLTLVPINDHNLRPFARTAADDEAFDTLFTADDLLPKSIVCTFGELSAATLNVLLETLEREIERLSRAERRQLQAQAVVQTTKAICAQLSRVETLAVTEAADNVSQLCRAFTTFADHSPDAEAVAAETLGHALSRLRRAVAQLVRLYGHAFPVDFELVGDTSAAKPEKELSAATDALLVHVSCVCQLSADWLNAFAEFRVTCELVHGLTTLASVQSRATAPSKSFFARLPFDEWLPFDWPLADVPREARLVLTLSAVRTESASSASAHGSSPTLVQIWQPLAVGAVQLFDHRQCLIQSELLVALWPHSDRTLVSDRCLDKNAAVAHIALPQTEHVIRFPSVVWPEQTAADAERRRGRLNALDSATQTELFALLNRNPLEPLSAGEREQLWQRRHYLCDCADALPKVLAVAHSWQWTALADTYAMAAQWAPLSAVDALQLLAPAFADTHIRRMAVQALEQLSSDQLCDFLPQLVQALRFEPYVDSPLMAFLLRRALSSVRVTHALYWLLKSQMVCDPLFAARAALVLNALLGTCGAATADAIGREEQMCAQLSRLCEHVKAAKESARLHTLLSGLEPLHTWLQSAPAVMLPLSPALLCTGVDVKQCSYFPSNSLPLKLVFRSADATLAAIFKVGDDLRQDMLSMQLIQIMDKLWLRERLNLRMVTFGCVATDQRKGMVEMVGESETLRSIQLEHGLTGPFKDRPIAEWLQKHNTSELEYHNAVENFTCSTAGYSVASYVLGLCDRHNDNIMLTTRGHLFHIDFGKFLGDAQTMAGIRRDRVAFVLTQDMAYVINGGDRPSKQFQFFVDLCCQAFNVLRQNAHLLVSLLSLLLHSGIAGVTADAVRSVYRALMPDLSDAQAMSRFTRLIDESLRSRSTQLNFFIHNLAQLRFTGDHNDAVLLSFVPKIFSRLTDGQIARLEVVDFCKKYEPEKVYYYVVRVTRAKQQCEPSHVLRTYREFVELNDKLAAQFPLARFHALPRGSSLMRSNTREVAVQRVHELSAFVAALLSLAHEISHSDLVYTFFHPILRDQIPSPATPPPPPSPLSAVAAARRQSLYGPAICGQVKLSLVYKNMSLVIMVMHAKNLQSRRSSVAPDSYAKTYLHPDPTKATKRKTRVVPKSCHPTFMELIVYTGMSVERLQQKLLQVSVWDYDRVTENLFMGAANIRLADVALHCETTDWYPLSAAAPPHP